MTSDRRALWLAPEGPDEETNVVSKKKLEEFLRELEERRAEVERLRKEAEELRRRLSVHENPNVPPSVRNQAPGYTRARSLTAPSERKKPGGQPGHEGVTRRPLPADEHVSLTTD